MPARSSLRDRMEKPVPKGRDALYSGSTSTVDGPPSPQAPAAAARPPRVGARGGETVGQNWTEAHQRVTFYCHRDLIGDIERAMGESNRSKTQVIVDALRDHLRAPV